MWNAGRISRLVLVPAGMLFVYCAGFALSAYMLFPLSVNYNFSRNLGISTLIILFSGGVLYYFARRKDYASGRFHPLSAGKPSPGDVILLLLPLTPVAQYTVINAGIVSTVGVVYVIAFFGLLSALFILVIPALLRGIADFRVLQAAGAAFTFSLTNMAILSRAHAWYAYGEATLQQVVFWGMLAVLLTLTHLRSRVILYAAVTGYFLAGFLLPLPEESSPEAATGSASEESDITSLLKEKSPEVTPNIYLLVYDAYAPGETMAAYGIDISQQFGFLNMQGFNLYPRAYTIHPETLSSMNSVLEVASISGSSPKAVSGDNQVVRHFKSLGYTTYGVFPTDYMFRELKPGYDEFLPVYSTPPYYQLIKSVLMGEFRFDSSFSKIPDGEFSDAKKIMLQRAAAGRSFVYTHSTRPFHSQNSGKCLPDETALYAERVQSANREMREDILTIIDHDPGALIIVMSDHGPYLTKNCIGLSKGYSLEDVTRLDIQDRYGTLLAIRWPDEDYKPYDDITVIQDIFPAVFAWMYRDAEVLKVKVPPVTRWERNMVAGASVNNGVIVGGVNDGESLFTGVGVFNESP